MKSATLPSGNCENWISRFRSVFSTGLNDRIEGCKNPRHFGEPLKGNHAGFWRYRIGDYRILCDIRDENVIVLVLTIGHRRHVYK